MELLKYSHWILWKRYTGDNDLGIDTQKKMFQVVENRVKQCCASNYGGNIVFPQITFLIKCEKLNRIGFIRVYSVALDLKYRLCSVIAKPHSNSAEINFFTPIHC